MDTKETLLPRHEKATDYWNYVVPRDYCISHQMHTVLGRCPECMERRRFTALAMHVFGGGMAWGFDGHIEVVGDIETFDLGLETVNYNLPKVEIQHHEHDVWSPSMASRFEGVDVLLGNPRCTGFSNFNANSGDDKFGSCAQQTRDIRQMLDVIPIVKPKMVVMESVQGFEKAGAALMHEIIDRTKFHYRHALVKHNCASHAVPQNRRRLFLVMYPRDKRFNPASGNVISRWPTVRDALQEPWLGLGSMLQDKFIDAKLISSIKEDDYPLIADNHVWEENSDLRRAPDLYKCLRQGMSIKNVHTEELPHVWRDRRIRGVEVSFHAPIRLCLDRPAPVIYAGAAKYVHPIFDRGITVREAARIMGVPDTYAYKGSNLYAQVGNGVCPPVASWIAYQCNEHLCGVHDDQPDMEAPDGVLTECSEPDKQLKIFEYTHLTPPLEPISKFWEREGIEVNREHRNDFRFY